MVQLNLKKEQWLSKFSFETKLAIPHNEIKLIIIIETGNWVYNLQQQMKTLLCIKRKFSTARGITTNGIVLYRHNGMALVVFLSMKRFIKLHFWKPYYQ